MPLDSSQDRRQHHPFILLVGCPGSGKSWLARRLQRQQPDYVIVSSDAIRAQLYGEAHIQGEWSMIASEIFRQIQQFTQWGKGIIYDATNVDPIHRQQFLGQLSQLDITTVDAWVLNPPLSLCLERNHRRSRQVPEAVIRKMFIQLQCHPPQLSEGFATVYTLFKPE